MLKNLIRILSFFLLIQSLASAQTYHCRLNWQDFNPAMRTFAPHATGLYFEDCIIDEASGLPVFNSRFKADAGFGDYHVEITDEAFEILTSEETALLGNLQTGASPLVLKTELSYIRKSPHLFVELLPFRTNPITGNIEKLVSFNVQITGSGTASLKTTKQYATQSVLATGNWIKFRTEQGGIYRITYEELLSAGLNMNGVHPDQIRIYGNGGAMLPEKNDEPRTDDLREIAIEVITSNPASFSSGDYILMYAPSPHTWRPLTTGNSLRFEHNKNIYSDYAWYFVTISDEPGKRVQSQEPVSDPATHQVTTFHDYAVYKPDLVNLAKVGRQWFGEKLFGNYPPLQLPVFHFPNIDSTHRVLLRGRFAIKATEMSRVRVSVNEFVFPGSLVAQPNAYVYANISTISSIFYTANPYLQVGVEYVNSNLSSAAWIDYIELNVKRHLVYTGEQMAFRDLSTVAPNYVSNFRLKNPVNGLKIWEITSIDEPKNIEYTTSDGEAIFRLPTSELREFISFTDADALHASHFEPVLNQNLHALEAHDMIIVSPAVFMPEANHYAQLRRNSSNLSVLVVELEQIYNEFASGSPDPTAIRDFMKMLYDRAPAGNEPKYLLLFGDGSYDPKDRLSNNNNFIPTFQSEESLRLDATYVSDDYFGLLDDGEGLGAAGSLDVGVGRFPINSIGQAAILHGKVEHYLLNRQATCGPWRNHVTLIAHDEDNDVHFIQSEEITAYIDTNHRVFTLDKIYLDAYQRVYIPSGYRYPEVTAAINQRVNEGGLLINYIGHGGETGWAHSKVLTVSDINAWHNLNNMPVFLTATCSFGRFDNPELLSAGEMVVLNQNGGGIALFTTSRLAYSSFNFRLNKSFTKFFFDRPAGRVASFGEILMRAKNDNDNNLYIRNFVLLGDPSLKPAIPEYNVVTTSVNGMDITESATLLGMTEVTVSGFIEDHQQQKMTGFNGILYPIVFDKTIRYMTNANHPSSTKRPFYIQNSILYKGKATVTNGEFTFKFVVPRDVNPTMGNGKISYYATNGEVDANGYFNGFVIGGLDPTALDDNGPLITMYLDTPDFRPGDQTGESPVLYARLHDESGINAFGLGIGHEIVALLNEDTQNPILLNDYFEPDIDTHTSGSIRYPFTNLPEGRHTLRLKAFDLNNNSSEAFIDFFVTSQLSLNAGNLINYPNPFSDGTWFRLNHNYFEQTVTLTIVIYDLQGRIRKTIGPETVTSTGSFTTPLYWNGRADDGALLNPGVYIYRVNLQSNNGQNSQLQGKLMINR